MASLGELALIWAGVFVADYLSRRSRLTPVLWYLFIGAVLVNAGILAEHPGDFIRGLSDIGIILIMFALGFEENTDNFLTSIRRSWGIALFGAVVPFLAAYAVAQAFWQDTAIALMCGLSMTATAVSLTMVSLQSEGMGRSVVATRIMTSAVLDDIGSLAMVAVLVPVATGEAQIGLSGIATVVGKAVLFFLAVTFVGGWVLPGRKDAWYSAIPLIGRFDMRHLLSIGHGDYAVLTIVLMALVTGLVAHAFGFHPAVGAYMAGLVLKEEYFTLDPEHSSFQRANQVVNVFAFEIFGPIFFVDLGAKLLFDWQTFVSVIPQMVSMTLALFVAQTASAALAARYTSALTWPQSMMVGFGMLGRAELAFVVMNIAYIDHHILTTGAFYTLMFTAFWLNIAVPVSIRLWKPSYEADRLPWRKS